MLTRSDPSANLYAAPFGARADPFNDICGTFTEPKRDLTGQLQKQTNFLDYLPSAGYGLYGPQTEGGITFRKARCNRQRKEIEMSRNLKVLGLAFVAIFALCAVAASAASADEFKAANGGKPITVTGSQELHGSPGVLDVFKTTFGELECEEASYSGTAAKTPTTAITVIPIYGNCFAASIIPAKIDVNVAGVVECAYNFTINPVAGKTDGWVDVECKNAGENILITVGAPGTVKCTIDVPQQTIGGVTYKNIAGGKVTVSVNAAGILYTETAGTGLGACKTSVQQNNGTYEGAATVSGDEDPGGAAVSISVA